MSVSRCSEARTRNPAGAEAGEQDTRARAQGGFEALGLTGAPDQLHDEIAMTPTAKNDGVQSRKPGAGR